MLYPQDQSWLHGVLWANPSKREKKSQRICWVFAVPCLVTVYTSRNRCECFLHERRWHVCILASPKSISAYTRSVKVNQGTRRPVFFDVALSWRILNEIEDSTKNNCPPDFDLQIHLILSKPGLGRRRSALVESSAMWWTTMRLSSQYEAKLMSRLGNLQILGWNMEQMFSEQTGYYKSRCTQWAWVFVLLRNNPGLILSRTQFQCVCRHWRAPNTWNAWDFMGTSVICKHGVGRVPPCHSSCIPLLIMHFRKTLSTLMFTQNH